MSTETSLWTGIKKGPPARLKFPQPDVVVAALQEALKAEQMHGEGLSFKHLENNITVNNLLAATNTKNKGQMRLDT